VTRVPLTDRVERVQRTWRNAATLRRLTNAGAISSWRQLHNAAVDLLDALGPGPEAIAGAHHLLAPAPAVALAVGVGIDGADHGYTTELLSRPHTSENEVIVSGHRHLWAEALDDLVASQAARPAGLVIYPHPGALERTPPVGAWIVDAGPYQRRDTQTNTPIRGTGDYHSGVWRATAVPALVRLVLPVVVGAS
jgi:hypothetical protein